MALDDERRALLLRSVRGNDFRRALKALAELRAAGETASAVVDPRRPDAQRAFQLRVARLVLEKGLPGLAAAWPGVGETPWRALLVSELGQFLSLWADDAVLDVAAAALDDAEQDVKAKAVWLLLSAARQQMPLTAPRRQRLTRGLCAMLKRQPRPVLEQIVEVLGWTACRDDAEALALLEGLREIAGKPYDVSFERVAKKDFAWYDKLVLARRGDDPGELIRIKHTPTGLLDEKVLKAALARIRGRAP